MTYYNDTESGELTDFGNDHQLVLDGTVYMDEFEEDAVPRIKGLVELFGDFLGD